MIIPKQHKEITIATPFNSITQKERLRVIGLISGTSADGIDAVAVDVEARAVQVLAFKTFPYSPPVRKALFGLFNPETSSVDDICHLNFVLGDLFADAAIALCAEAGISLKSVDLIASHGQTIWHEPLGRRAGRRLTRSTLQIAEPSVIAQRTGITTVADFRPRDVAAGGQGAPLVPYADHVLFTDTQKHRAVQNIGGIANVTFLPPACKPADIIAFDTGPGNMVIDAIAERISRGRIKYDRDGRLAAKGTPDPDLLKHLLSNPYFRRRPPRTTGREQFGAAYADTLYRKARRAALSDADLMATVTALTARTIADGYRRFLPTPPDEVILYGGGARNCTLVAMLRQELPNAAFRRTDEFGIDVDAKEAVSFAVLAYATVKGTPNNIPRATGADHPAILGKIILA
jgi:anhydro-N-acetylmuramic acid kinase